MKRTGNLLAKIADFENLLSAYYKAQKGKAAKPELRSYGRNLNRNLATLREELLSGVVSVGDYRLFTIHDPKKRQVCAAPFPQRVMHHALMNVCHPFFEKRQIFDSYASRRGKGTFAALERAKAYCGGFPWFCKLDVRKYFDSIDHTVLRQLLRRLFKDAPLLAIFDRIIDSYHISPGRGVPIGNLTSQYFANLYLAGADHFVKERLRIPAYARYMDDMVLWHDDKSRLLRAVSAVREFVNEALKLTLKPSCLNRCDRGLPFLGFLVFPGKISLAFRSRKRFVVKSRSYEDFLTAGEWSQESYQRHILPLVAFTEHADARGFRRSVFYPGS